MACATKSLSYQIIDGLNAAAGSQWRVLQNLSLTSLAMSTSVPGESQWRVLQNLSLTPSKENILDLEKSQWRVLQNLSLTPNYG